MVVVGGTRCPDKDTASPSVTYRTVAAFDYATGHLLWEYDTAVECVGYDSESPEATPDTVVQIQRDGDDNLVCMMRRFDLLGATSDNFLHEDAHWVTLDNTGALVEAKTFARQTNYAGIPITPISFDINTSDGSYHIAGIDYGDDFDPPRQYGSEYQFLYGWETPFSSPPTLYEAALGGGTPTIFCTPSSLIRHGGKDWLGGYSTYGNSERNYVLPGPDSQDLRFLHGAIRASSDSLIDSWSDVDVKLSKRHDEFSTVDIGVLTAGSSQGTGATLTANAINSLLGFANSILLPGGMQALVLPDGAHGDVLVIDPSVANADPLYSPFTKFYKLFPPVDGRIIYDFVTVLDADVAIIPEVYSDSWGLSLGLLKCTCLGDDGDGLNVWLVEAASNPIICNTPYPSGEFVYTVGRYGLIVKWLDGDVHSWCDCVRVQAIADTDGNTFGTGALQAITGGPNSTITKRDPDGTFLWAHIHAGALNFVQARMIHLSADETALFVSGSAGAGGPVKVEDSIDFIDDPCIVEEICDGFCKYIAGGYDIVNIDSHTGTYTFTCHASVIAEGWAGGGGGGGASGATKGAGGGGQGEHFAANWFVLKDTVLSWGVDEDSDGEGQGGVGPDGQDGRNGTDMRVWTALTDPLFILRGGFGGEGTQNLGGTPAGGLGGGVGPFAGAPGDPGADYLGGDGGGFGYTGGDSGKGGTGNAFGAVDPPIAGGLNGGGGGGGYDSDGADGGGQHFVMEIYYLHWILDETEGSSDCADGCECRDPTDELFIDQFGCPAYEDDFIHVRCVSG